MVNFYELLDIPTNATAMEIEKAVRLARQRGDVEEKLLQQARNCLIDANMRKVYDKKMGIKAAARVRSGLKSDTPFWIPVFVIASIMIVSAGGMYWARKDARDKRQEANFAQEQAIRAKEDAANGDTGPNVKERVMGWLQTAFKIDAKGPQFMLSSKQLNSSFSVFKEMKLLLVLPEGEQPTLVMFADQPFQCQEECRVKLSFNEYTQFALPSKANGNILEAAASESLVSEFRRDGKVLVTMPDKDNSQFIFEYKALP